MVTYIFYRPQRPMSQKLKFIGHKNWVNKRACVLCDSCRFSDCVFQKVTSRQFID